MNRTEEIAKLTQQKKYDIIIIGGGASGLGCAVDAASRGYKTLLLEKYDFAKGTSSRATKLIHGGVRYLAQGNIRLVREALFERGRLLQNAPHVCHTLPFVVPTYRWWHKYYYGTGLWLYEFLSGKLSLGKTSLLSASKTLEQLPGLSKEKLSGGILYYDGQFDDSRLAINLAQTAIEQGATVLNYCGADGFVKEADKIVAVRCTDSFSGQTFAVQASVVINATGVFADEVLQLAEGHAEKTIAPSQGIHLVVDKHFFEGDTAMMIPKTDDGRVLFAIPWHNKMLLGTTDTPVQEITTEPRALKEEVDFVISHFNRYTTSEIGYADVKSVFTGLRPLAKVSGEKRTAVMPRDHVIKVLPSGLVHVTGGKWTTYRSMAQHAIDKAVAVSQLAAAACKTKKLAIHGSTNDVDSSHLSIYGTDAAAINRLAEDNPGLSEKIHPAYPYTKAEVVFCIQHEMAVTIEDVLARRIRLLFLDAAAALQAVPVVAALFREYAGCSREWEQTQLNAFTDLAKGYLINF